MELTVHSSHTDFRFSKTCHWLGSLNSIVVSLPPVFSNSSQNCIAENQLAEPISNIFFVFCTIIKFLKNFALSSVMLGTSFSTQNCLNFFIYSSLSTIFN